MLKSSTKFDSQVKGKHLRRLLVYLFLFCVMIQCRTLAQVTPTQPATASGPIYWQQPTLFIPYQVNSNLPAAREIAEVQLLLSRTGSGDWMVLQSAKPNVQGFSYHAPEDGQYWFALKHLDAKGQPLDGSNVTPQLHLVIDTEPPQLLLSATRKDSGQIAIRYEATDANLNPQSLLIEARSEGSLWTNVSLGPPQVSQLGQLIGTAHWLLPPLTDESSSAEIEIRASVADATGQRGQAVTAVPALDPALTMPPPSTPTDTSEQSNVASTPPQFSPMQRDPFESSPAQEWPSDNQLPIVNNAPQVGPPPLINPYVTGKVETPSRRTPAKFAVEGSEAVQNGEPDNFAPNLLSNSSSQDTPLALPSTDDAEWSSAGTATNSPLLVNARTFDVEYELASVGTWGVAKVEIWGTPDGGNTWQSFGADPDNRSPARITVPHGGTFGFRILVEGANSVGVTPPQPGDKPELVLTVDLTPPTTEILAVEPGEGNLSDHLRIRWKAEDDNLEAQPVGLFYSSYPNGPWSNVASGLENTGSYLWRIERHIPGRFYLRIEVRDTAGNMASQQTPQPIELNRPQPTGTLRSIKPVSDVPTVGR